MLDAAVKCGMRPIRYPSHIPVFERVDMTVIDMRRIILVIANHILPEPALPDPTLAACDTHPGSIFGHRQRFGEILFDQFPAIRKIIIAGRQRPHTVQMVRQNDPRIDVKRSFSSDFLHYFPQHGHLPDQQIIRIPRQQVDREKISPSGYPIPAIVRHPSAP